MEVSCDENDAKEAMSIVVNEPQHDLHQLTHGQVETNELASPRHLNPNGRLQIEHPQDNGHPLQPPDEVDGHTLSSVRLQAVGCPDPAMLSNIFQDAPSMAIAETLIVPLPDAIDITDQIVPASSYMDNSTSFLANVSSQSFPSIISPSGNDVDVPPLTHALNYHTTHTTTSTTVSTLLKTDSGDERRLSVLARTWTESLTGYLSSGRWADVEIRCGEGGETRFSCHRMLLAAASPFLARCLRTVPGQEEVTSLMLPDFTVDEVAEFLQTIYLQWRGQPVEPDTLLGFLADQPVKDNVDEEKVKFEEKVIKKMPVEVKMEEACGTDYFNNIFENDDSVSAKYDLEENGQRKSDSNKAIVKTNRKRPGPHKCEKCGKTFKLQRILKEHMFLHGEPRYECTYKSDGCERKFHLKANLKAHIDVIHLKKKNIPCEICGKLFYNHTHLRNHMEHHNTEKHICEHCSSSFSCTKSLRDHIKFKHTSVENLPNCSICNKTYSTPQNLKNHFARVHLQERKYVCSECGRQFYEKAELDIHTSVHNPKDQNIECDICKLMFKNNKTLYYHKKRSHDPEGKKHVCYVCGKCFNDSHFLNRHMESHQGKLCLCKQCGKGFASEHKVKVHIQKVHEKWRRKEEPDKPCPLCANVRCEKKFPTWGGMKRHLKDVHKMSVMEANTLLIKRFRLDPKKHRMNPSEIMPLSMSTGELSTTLLS